MEKDIRSLKKELSLIFNCSEDQIATKRSEIKKDTIYYSGNLNLNKIISTEGLILPQNIGGNLYLNGLTSVGRLILPRSIGGNLSLNRLISAGELVLPQSIGGDLYLNSLTSIRGLILPEQFNYRIYMNGFVITPENIDQYKNSKKVL